MVFKASHTALTYNRDRDFVWGLMLIQTIAAKYISVPGNDVNRVLNAHACQ